MPPFVASAHSQKRRIRFVAGLAAGVLPRKLRAPFAVQKLKCLAWLREHTPRPESTRTRANLMKTTNQQPKASASAEASAKTEQRIARDNILKQQEPL